MNLLEKKWGGLIGKKSGVDLLEKKVESWNERKNTFQSINRDYRVFLSFHKTSGFYVHISIQII